MFGSPDRGARVHRARSAGPAPTLGEAGRPGDSGAGVRSEGRVAGAGHSSGPRVGFSRAASAGVGTAGDLQVPHGVSHWIPDEAPHTLATMLLDHTGTHT